ncbi:toxin-antitoxin system, toxin component, MazF domain protein, partial [Ostertagia ostertagi]
MQSEDHGLKDAINLLSSDPTVPAHLETIIGHLLDSVMRKDHSVIEGYEILAADVLFENTKIRLMVVYGAPSCSSAHNEQLMN